MKKILISLIFGVSIFSSVIAQENKEKIISGELNELIRSNPEAERIVIVCLKANDEIKQLQLKSETRSQYLDRPYLERTDLALSNQNLNMAYQKLLQLGEPFYAPYGEETPDGPIIDSTHYYLFMNAFLFKAKAKNIELMKHLEEVKLIIDGEQMIELRANTNLKDDTDEIHLIARIASSVELVTNYLDSGTSMRESLHFLKNKNSIIRYAEIELNNEIRSLSNLQEGDFINLNVFIDKEFNSIVERIYFNINNTLIIRTKLNDFEYAYATITTTDERTLIDIQIPELREWYMVISNPASLNHYVVQVDYNYREDFQYSSPQIIIDTDEDIIEQQRVASVIQGKNLGPEDEAEINIMVVYTYDAVDWANNNASGINNVIAQAMDKAQTVLDNSQTFVKLTLIYSSPVVYDETGNMDADLRRLTASPTYNPFGDSWVQLDDDGNIIGEWNIPGYMDIVHEWRNSFGADFVSLLTHTGEYAGVAWLLQNKDGNPNRAFSITKVEYAASSYTFIHEIGHNMGCHHHKNQNQGPGPTIWTNWPENQWSAGWRWVKTGWLTNNYYCSVMTYENGSFFADGKTHTRVPYFSNPDISYQGVSIGDVSHGNNSRTIKEIKHVLANYRAPTWHGLTNSNWGYGNVEISQLHDMGYKGEGLKIGIIDLGIDHNHPLVNMVSTGSDWNDSKLNVLGTAYTWPVYFSSKDTDGHGTSVAGVIWQMAPNAEFYIYRIMGNKIGLINNLWFNNSVNWMKNKDVNIINLSWAVNEHHTSCPASLKTSDIKFDNAADQNTICVNAAGNLGSGDIFPISPGYGENVLSVFSIDGSNEFCDGSSPQFPCPGYRKPDFAAPGCQILTFTLIDYGSFIYEWGSSFAAPHTAGIAAVLRQAAAAELNITNNSEVVMNSIRNTLLPVGGFPTSWGDYNPGRINAWEAYKYLTQPEILTVPPTHITMASAYVGGEVLREGTSTVSSHGIYWGTQEDLINTGIQIAIGSGVGEFFITLDGLQKNTTYYVAAYATDASGTYLGKVLSFTTPATSNIFVYTAPLNQIFAPQVQLTPTTIAVLNASQQTGQPLTLSFNITHTSKSISTARLFYKNTDSEIYNNVDLVNTSGDLYEYTIPGNEVIAGSMNFFVTASDDGGQTVSLPSFQYLEYPFPIGVLPNLPPSITHVSIDTASVGDQLTIVADVSDSTALIVSVVLMHRRHDLKIYSIIEMQQDTLGHYIADLPIISEDYYYMINPIDSINGIDYIIKAEDEYGALSYFPSDFAETNIPHNILVEYKQPVTFLITDQYDRPIELASITLLNQDSSFLATDIYTNNEGFVTIMASESEYDYVITKSGHYSAYGEFSLSNTPKYILVTLQTELPVFANLSIVKNPFYCGEVSGAGSYEIFSTVSLEAIPFEGYSFLYWSIDEDTIGLNSNITFNMPLEDLTITANFAFCGSPTNVFAAVQGTANIQISWSPPSIMGVNSLKSDYNCTNHRDNFVFNDTMYLFSDSTDIYSLSISQVDDNNLLKNLVNSDQIILHYDGENAGLLGLTNGGTFYVAANFPSDLTSQYLGFKIESVDIFVGGMPSNSVLRLSTPSSVLYEQSFIPVASNWNNIILNEPIILSGDSLIVSVKYSHNSGVNPAGFDSGPANPNGDWMSFDGNQWFHLGIGRNFNIRVRIQPHFTVLNYLVLRNDLIISTLDATTLSFTDGPLISGQYNYSVVSVFDECFSNHSYAQSINLTHNINASISPQFVAVFNGQNKCFEAIETITVGGEQAHFVVLPGGSAKLVAGQSIRFLPNTLIQRNSYVHAFISKNGLFCFNPPSMLENLDEESTFAETMPAIIEPSPLFKLYPNPTTDAFTLELTRADVFSKAIVEIYSLMGNIVGYYELNGATKYAFDLSNRPRGVYLIRVMAGDEIGVEKLIKQ